VAVLYRHHVVGMDAGTYDRAAVDLIPQLKQQPGFLYHIAFPEGDGFTVDEVWESREQQDRWFQGSVKPNVPGEIKLVAAVDVHNVVAP